MDEQGISRLLQVHKTEIVRCIKEPKIISILEATTIISPDDAKKLRSDYQTTPNLWVTHLLDLINESREPGRWAAFIQSLQEADYPYLLDLLNGVNFLNTVYFIKKIGIHKDMLEQTLRIGDVLSKLRSKDVLNEIDCQEIIAFETNKGNQLAVSLLLDRIQCRLEPSKWYYSFLETLKECNNYDDALLNIDPDFMKHNIRYSSAQGIGSKSDQCCSMDVDEKDVKEHILEDHAEADVTMNNLSQAPLLSAKNEILGDNLKPLNIKPEMSKPLMLGEFSLTNLKDEAKEIAIKQEEGTEKEDLNQLNSDYEDDEDDSGMFKLQKFQLELAEKAVAGTNTVVVAPTGTGKTWVAFYIMQQHLKAATNEKRKVAFMAKTGALIKQQSDRIKKYLPEYETKLLQGDGDVGAMMGEFLKDYDILCFTPQILVNNLDSGSVKSLSQFSLILLDECHHTKGDSPYASLMRKYLLEKFNARGKLPQIVGLTATLGVGKSSTDEDALEYMHRIFALLDVTEISTVEIEREEMLQQTSAPDEKIIKMKVRQDDPGRGILLRAIEDTEAMLEDMALLQPTLIDMMVEKCPPCKESQEYNKWAHEIQKSAMHNVNDLNTTRDIQACANYLIIYNEALEVNSLLQTKDVIKFMAEKHRLDSEQKSKLTSHEQKLLDKLQDVQRQLRKKAHDNENPNVRDLCTLLREMLENGGEESRAMVFVKARATCKALASFINKDLQDIVTTKPLYGKETRGFEEGMTQAVQDLTVQRFREGEYKVLVATSIGVEGIDIPECNMSLNYNYLGNEVTKVQMRDVKKNVLLQKHVSESGDPNQQQRQRRSCWSGSQLFEKCRRSLFSRRRPYHYEVMGRIRKRGGVNVTILREQDLDKERMSAYKEAMMHRAMEMFKKQNRAVVERKIKLFQKEEISKARFRQETELYKKRRKTDEGDFEIRCKRCNTLACYISDVRTIKKQFLVIDKNLVDRINIRPHKSPKEYDGFNKNRKMYCKKCPLDWGIIAVKDGLDCRILKLECFKLVNLETRGVAMYKKWDDVPYRIPEIDVDDLPRLLGEKQEN